MKRTTSIALLLIALLVGGCAQRNTINVHDLEVIPEGTTYLEWINGQESQPVIASEWTAANRGWLAADITGQLADLATTAIAIDDGCEEANPIMGDGDIGAMALIKVASFGLRYWLAEYGFAGNPNQSTYRNWIYGAGAVAGWGAAAWNTCQDCGGN